MITGAAARPPAAPVRGYPRPGIPYTLQPDPVAPPPMSSRISGLDDTLHAYRVELVRARRVLEVGACTGCPALAMARERART